jgi:hypothetical protein
MQTSLASEILKRFEQPPDQTGIMLDTFYQIMMIMRHADVERFSDEVVNIYCALTGNAFLASMHNGSNISVLNIYHEEIRKFVESRVVFLIDSFVNKIVKVFEIDPYTNHTFRIGKKKYDQGVSLLPTELQLLEFEISQLLDVYVHNVNPLLLNEETRYAPQEEIHNIELFLTFAVVQYYKVKGELANNDNIIKFNAPTVDSVKSLIVLGLMIARIMCAYYTSHTGGNLSESDLAAVKLRMVIDEYAKYSSMGSMNLSSILCCFKNTAALPAAIVNHRSRLGTTEKSLLLNVLVLSMLLK